MLEIEVRSIRKFLYPVLYVEKTQLSVTQYKVDLTHTHRKYLKSVAVNILWQSYQKPCPTMADDTDPNETGALRCYCGDNEVCKACGTPCQHFQYHVMHLSRAAQLGTRQSRNRQVILLFFLWRILSSPISWRRKPSTLLATCPFKSCSQSWALHFS